MNPDSTSPSPATVLGCPSCGGEVGASLLSCPSCHWLVHGERLKALAASGEASERDGDPSAALASWQEALTLLPRESRQHATIAGRISRLNRQVESGPVVRKTATPKVQAGPSGPAPESRWSGGVISGVVGTVALAVWKFKFLAVLLLSKGKLLLLGLTKASTFWSMLAALGVYWTAFGPWFALGLVISIYIHEMGHVAALMRYGVKASAPLFLPGIGAVIRLKQGFTDPRQDARVGLAGPIWGLGAAVACAGIYAVSRQPIWAALAQLGGLINLFNLIPIWQLDGGRAFRSLNRPQRWLAVAGIATAWAVSQNEQLNMLLLALMVVGAVRTLVDKPANEPDRGILVQYVGLVALLTALSSLPVPKLP
jgi:Zn-dependent protease